MLHSDITKSKLWWIFLYIYIYKKTKTSGESRSLAVILTTIMSCKLGRQNEIWVDWWGVEAAAFAQKQAVPGRRNHPFNNHPSHSAKSRSPGSSRRFSQRAASQTCARCAAQASSISHTWLVRATRAELRGRQPVNMLHGKQMWGWSVSML